MIIMHVKMIVFRTWECKCQTQHVTLPKAAYTYRYSNGEILNILTSYRNVIRINIAYL